MAQTSVMLGQCIYKQPQAGWRQGRGVAKQGDHPLAQCLVPKMHTEEESNGPTTRLRPQQSIKREKVETGWKRKLELLGSRGPFILPLTGL